MYEEVWPPLIWGDEGELCAQNKSSQRGIEKKSTKGGLGAGKNRIKASSRAN